MLAALHSVIRRGDVDGVRAILASDPSVIRADFDGWAVLHHVAEYDCCPKVLTVLLEAGAEVNALTSYNNTPLHIAASSGRCQTVESLLRAGASVVAQNQFGLTLLHVAVKNGPEAMEACELLVCAGAVVSDTICAMAAACGMTYLVGVHARWDGSRSLRRTWCIAVVKFSAQQK